MAYYVPNKKTVIWTIVSHVVSLILLLAFLTWEYGILQGKSEPARQGFYCNDDSIKYINTKNTVPTVVCVIIYLAIAFPLVIFVELISFQTFAPSETLKNSLPWKKVCRYYICMMLLKDLFFISCVYVKKIQRKS